MPIPGCQEEPGEKVGEQLDGTPLITVVTCCPHLLHQNEPEITVIINLARLYHGQGKQYRIITPYDAQRSAIERQLELVKPKIPWEDKCFNVDSFQGKQCLDMLKDLSDIRHRKRRRPHHRLSSSFRRYRVLEERAQDERHADAVQEKHDYLYQS
jgi:hypothetical protein